MMVASVLAVQKDLSGSAEQLHNVPFWWPEKPLAQYREGVAAMAAGRAKAAEAAWKACVANDPLHPTPPQVFTDSVKGLVGLYKLEERKEEARALLWWAYEQTAPDGHPQILIMLVWMELRRSELTASIDTLRRFVAATPDDWEARRALASAEMELGREAEAKREIQACLKARPGDLRVWRDWLALLGKQGDRDALLAAVGQLPKAADGDPECWKFRGLAREKMGDFKGATEAYRRAIKLRADDETGLFRLAIVEQRLGERDRADAHRKRSQELREAHQQLRKAYDDYLDCTASSSVDGKALTDAISRLASNCEVLGLTRDAEAWRRLLPRDFTAEGAGKAEKPKN
jgi:tetratricopeptide (TPR) repeat protein